MGWFGGGRVTLLVVVWQTQSSLLLRHARLARPAKLGEKREGLGSCRRMFCGAELYVSCWFPWFQNETSNNGVLIRGYHRESILPVLNGKRVELTSVEAKREIEYWKALGPEEFLAAAAAMA